MLHSFQQHLSENFPFLKGKKLLLAISGGLDSVVLTHLLYASHYNIALAHVNFHLRGVESDADAQFVTLLAQKLNVPIYIQQVDTQQYANEKGVSIQMAARELRYQWFETLLNEKELDYLLTAHHLDDSIETFFINLNRKSGLEGLTGIPETNGNIIRPLLPFSRKEIEHYASENQLTWCEDSSNATLKYERNKIRHQLYPVLENINPDFRKDFGKSMEYLNHANTLIKDYLNVLKPNFWHQKQGEVHIYLMELKKVHHYEYVLFELLKPFGFTDWQSIFELIDAQSGKKIHSDRCILLKDRENLILKSLSKNDTSANLPLLFNENAHLGNLSYKAEQITKLDFLDFSLQNTFYFDADKLIFPLYFRHWEEGDYFYPLGLNGRKKLSDFFTDHKLSLFDKEKIWLLCDAQNRIVWVVNYRQDDRFKITENSKNVLKIVLNP